MSSPSPSRSGWRTELRPETPQRPKRRKLPDETPQRPKRRKLPDASSDAEDKDVLPSKARRLTRLHSSPFRAYPPKGKIEHIASAPAADAETSRNAPAEANVALDDALRTLTVDSLTSAITAAEKCNVAGTPLRAAKEKLATLKAGVDVAATVVAAATLDAAAAGAAAATAKPAAKLWRTATKSAAKKRGQPEQAASHQSCDLPASASSDQAASHQSCDLPASASSDQATQEDLASTEPSSAATDQGWRAHRLGDIEHRVVVCEDALAVHAVLVNIFSQKGATYTVSEAEVISIMCSVKLAEQASRQIDIEAARAALVCLTVNAVGWLSTAAPQPSEGTGIIFRRCPGSCSEACAEQLKSQLEQLKQERRYLLPPPPLRWE